MPTINGNSTSERIWGTNDSAGDSIFGQGGNDTIEAGNGGDFVYGGDGNDTLYGQGGDDRFGEGYHGRGNDFIEGGDGFDTVDYNGSTEAVFVNLDQHMASGLMSGNDALWGIENVVGTSQGDILVGNNGGILGIGGLGENWIVAGGGNDEVLGLGGNDLLEGNDGNDALDGGDGDDRLFGQAGNDRLVGGRGNDSFDGGAGIDTVSYSGATEGVRMYVESGLPTSWGGSEGTDTFFGVENLVGSGFDDIITGSYLGENTASRIDGGNGNDAIYAGGGNDTVTGGTGNDTIRGDLGVDVLTGGDGGDDFEFWSTEPGIVTGVGQGNRDYITDFQPGTDTLSFFTPQSLDPVSANYGVNDFTFVGQAGFTAPGQLRVEYFGGDTIVQGNTDPDGSPEFEVQLSGHLTLSASDFYLF